MFLSSKVNYLGVLIDSSLTWRPHINELAKKLNRSAAIIAKLQHFVPLKTLKGIYFSLFQSYLAYGCLVWGYASKCDLRRLYLIQKRVIRIITSFDYYERTSPLFARLKILKLDDLIQLHRHLILYDWNKGDLPLSLQHIFSLRTHNRTTRSTGHKALHTPYVRTVKYGDKSLRNSGPELFSNIVNISVDQNLTKSQFKKYLHALFTAKY